MGDRLMKRLVRYVLLLVFLFCAPRVHATGGTCPSTANMDGGLYAAPTNCYYVDFASGSDSNSGTTESAPFKHAAGMVGAGGNVPAGCSAGVGWIFKGGVTWDYTILPWYIGANANCTGDSAGNDSYGGCTGAHCVYFGVDHSWHTGSSWTRPIFSAGDWSNPSAPTCKYDVFDSHSGFQPTNLFNLTYQSDIIVDNFEFTGMCSSHQDTYKDPFANYLSAGNPSSYITVENSYFHRVAWYISQNGSTGLPNSTTLNVGSAAGDFAYAASFGGATFAHWTYNVVDFSDSGPTPTSTNGFGPQYPVWVGQATFNSGGGTGPLNYDHSVAAYMPDATANNWGQVHDSYFYQASNMANQNTHSSPPCPSGVQATGGCGQHGHVANDGGCVGNAYWYNNVIDVAVFGQMWQPLIASGTCTFYVFNNVMTNVTGNRYLNFGSTSNGITFFMFNNTLECGDDSAYPVTGATYPLSDGGTFPGFPPSEVCGAWGQFTALSLYNMHFITSGHPITCGSTYGGAAPCPSFTDSATTVTNATFNTFPGSPSDLITQTQSIANGQGYAYARASAFAPTSSSGATVGAGVNKTGLCNSMPDPLAAAACRKDTTGAVTYNTINHTAVCCARTPNARPSSGAWDVGAYEFSGASGNAPQPPSGLVANVQ
jgi:hypothetical protein